jgi:hypothetical protein
MDSYVRPGAGAGARSQAGAKTLLWLRFQPKFLAPCSSWGGTVESSIPGGGGAGGPQWKNRSWGEGPQQKVRSLGGGGSYLGTTHVLVHIPVPTCGPKNKQKNTSPSSFSTASFTTFYSLFSAHDGFKNLTNIFLELSGS